jgi:hypothetical protein
VQKFNLWTEKRKEEKRKKRKKKGKKEEKKIRSFFIRNKAGETWSWKTFIFLMNPNSSWKKILLRITWTSFNNPKH